MRLDLPLPRSWAVVERGARTVVEILPGVLLAFGALERLPRDLGDWGDRVVLAGVRPETYRPLVVEDTATAGGWPLTLVSSEVVRAGTVVEHRLHALYHFLEWGGVAVLTGTAGERFAAAADEARPVLLEGRPDFRTDEVLTVAELWDGLAPTPGPAPRSR
ncbi:MAG TPA: hypothetical protein VKE22_22415 [Haliangiales bacterium]|nr:hypothetical protein [Haliangiales bacterium]